MIILDIHPIPFFIIFAVLCLVYYMLFKKNKLNPGKKLLCYYAYLFYFVLLVKVTVFPVFIIYSSTGEHIYKNVRWLNIKPFDTVMKNFSSTSGMIQFLGNIILLMPLVYFLKYMAEKRFSSLKIMALSFLTSVAIEGIQALINICTEFPCHAVDIDDVILNASGAFLMLCILKLIDKLNPEFLKRINRLFVTAEL